MVATRFNRLRRARDRTGKWWRPASPGSAGSAIAHYTGWNAKGRSRCRRVGGERDHGEFDLLSELQLGRSFSVSRPSDADHVTELNEAHPNGTKSSPVGPAYGAPGGNPAWSTRPGFRCAGSKCSDIDEPLHRGQSSCHGKVVAAQSPQKASDQLRVVIRQVEIWVDCLLHRRDPPSAAAGDNALTKPYNSVPQKRKTAFSFVVRGA